MKKTTTITAAATLLTLPALLAPPASAATLQQKVEKPLTQSIDTRKAAQGKVEKWQGDRADLNARFDALKEETRELSDYKTRLEQAVAATRKRLEAKRAQIAETEEISEQIAPFLQQMLTHLGEAINDGPPFLKEERRNRLTKMEEMMADPEITAGEKYRRLMEALQIEAEYGFTTEVYPSEIPTDDGPLQVSVFRLGRLGLFAMNLNGQVCGFYDEAADKWQKLDEKWVGPIAKVIAMARKEEPIGLVTLPLGRIKGAAQQ